MSEKYQDDYQPLQWRDFLVVCLGLFLLTLGARSDLKKSENLQAAQKQVQQKIVSIYQAPNSKGE